MTLSERLNKYKLDNNLCNIKLSEIINVDKSTVSKVLRGAEYSPVTAEKIYKSLGDEFKKYVEYKKCPHCGDQYIGRSKLDASCRKDECIKKQRRKNQIEYAEKVKSGEIVPKRNKAFHRKVFIADESFVINKEDSKHIQGFAEFMNGKQYGDRQREYLLNLQKTQRMEIR